MILKFFVRLAINRCYIIFFFIMQQMYVLFTYNRAGGCHVKLSKECCSFNIKLYQSSEEFVMHRITSDNFSAYRLKFSIEQYCGRPVYVLFNAINAKKSRQMSIKWGLRVQIPRSSCLYYTQPKVWCFSRKLYFLYLQFPQQNCFLSKRW